MATLSRPTTPASNSEGEGFWGKRSEECRNVTTIYLAAEGVQECNGLFIQVRLCEKSYNDLERQKKKLNSVQRVITTTPGP